MAASNHHNDRNHRNNMVPHPTRSMAVIHLETPCTLFINEELKETLAGGCDKGIKLEWRCGKAWNVQRMRVWAVTCFETQIKRDDCYTEYTCNFFDDSCEYSHFSTFISFAVLKKQWTSKMFLVMLMCEIEL